MSILLTLLFTICLVSCSLDKKLMDYLDHLNEVDEILSQKFHGTYEGSAMEAHRRDVEGEGAILHPFSKDHLEMIEKSDPFGFDSSQMESEIDVLSISSKADGKKLESLYSKGKFSYRKSVYEDYTGAFSEMDYEAHVHKGTTNLEAFSEDLKVMKCPHNHDLSSSHRDIFLELLNNDLVHSGLFRTNFVPGSRLVIESCPSQLVLYGIVHTRGISTIGGKSVVKLSVLEVDLKTFFLNLKVNARNYQGNETRVRELIDHLHSSPTFERRYRVEKRAHLKSFNWNYDEVSQSAKEEIMIYDHEEGGFRCELKCKDCWAYLNPEFWLIVETSWGSLVHFEVGISGKFRSQIQMFAGAYYDREWDWKNNLLDMKVMSMKFFIGAFPVVIDYDFSVDLLTHLEVHASVTLTETVLISADASFAYVFDEDSNKNELVKSFTSSVEYGPPEITLDGQVLFRVYTEAGFHVIPYGIFDVMFIPDPWIELDLQAHLSENSVTFLLSRGIDIVARIPPLEVLGKEYTLGGQLPVEWRFTYLGKTMLPCTFTSCTSPTNMVLVESEVTHPGSPNENFDNQNEGLGGQSGGQANALPSGYLTKYLGDPQSRSGEIVDFSKGKEWNFYNVDPGGVYTTVVNCNKGAYHCYVRTGLYNMTRGNFTWFNNSEFVNVSNGHEENIIIKTLYPFNQSEIHAAVSITVVQGGQFAVSFLETNYLNTTTVWRESNLTNVDYITVPKHEALLLYADKKMRYSDNIVISVIHKNDSELASFLYHVNVYDAYTDEKVCQTDGFYPIIFKEAKSEYRIIINDAKKVSLSHPCPVDIRCNARDYRMDVMIKAFAGVKNPVSFKVAMEQLCHVDPLTRRVNVSNIYPYFNYLFDRVGDASEYAILWENSYATNLFSFVVTSGRYGQVIGKDFIRAGGDVFVTDEIWYISSSSLGLDNVVGYEYFVLHLDEEVILDEITSLDMVPTGLFPSGVKQEAEIGYEFNHRFRSKTEVNRGTYEVLYNSVTVIMKKLGHDCLYNIYCQNDADEGSENLVPYTDVVGSEYRGREVIDEGPFPDLRTSYDFYVLMYAKDDRPQCARSSYSLQIFHEFVRDYDSGGDLVRVGPASFSYVSPSDNSKKYVKLKFTEFAEPNRTVLIYMHNNETVGASNDVDTITFDDLLMKVNQGMSVGHSKGKAWIGLYNPFETQHVFKIEFTSLPKCDINVTFLGGSVVGGRVKMDASKIKYQNAVFGIQFNITGCDDAQTFSRKVVTDKNLVFNLLDVLLNSSTSSSWWNSMVSCFKTTVGGHIEFQAFQMIKDFINVDNPKLLKVWFPMCSSLSLPYPNKKQILGFKDGHNFTVLAEGDGSKKIEKVLTSEDDRSVVNMVGGHQIIELYTKSCSYGMIWSSGMCVEPDSSQSNCVLLLLLFLTWLVVWN